jgi:ClpP class serine protease
MIGDMGYVWSSLWLDRFAQKYDVRQEYVYSPENKVKYNPFEPMKESHEKWLQNYLYENEHSLKSAIVENREEHFLRNGVIKF